MDICSHCHEVTCECCTDPECTCYDCLVVKLDKAERRIKELEENEREINRGTSASSE